MSSETITLPPTVTYDLLEEASRQDVTAMHDQRFAHRRPQSPNPRIKYLVIGDWVRSRSDGQRHWISAERLVELYKIPHGSYVGMSMDSWVEYQLGPTHYNYRWRGNPTLDECHKLIKLEPREDGDYRLPKPLIDPTFEGMAVWVNAIFGPDAINDTALVFSDWLQEQCDDNLHQAAANIRSAHGKELPAARQEINVAAFEWRWRDGLEPSRRKSLVNL